MNILKQKLEFFNTTLHHIPKQLTILYHFGFWALTEQRITSIRGNARQLVQNPHTAKTKAWRLLKNRRWKAVIPALLKHLQLVTERSIVCLDFSDFHRWQVLTFAIQTRSGRAVPVYFEIIKYPITENSQNIFIVRAVERFVTFVGCRPKLVMDRGFACPYIIQQLAQRRHLFIVRIKACKQLTKAEKQLLFKARYTSLNDQRVWAYEGRRLRLIVSDKKEGSKERWYLITNDFTSTRDQLMADYYHRFEIEEFFKDAKWLLGLEWVRLFKLNSITTLLWFVALGMWFVEFVRKNLTLPAWKNHHNVSVVRFVYETIQRETQGLLAQSLGLQPGWKGGAEK